MRLVFGEYRQRPRSHAHERLDCSVRALRIAAGVEYATAHLALMASGRVDRHGIQNWVMDRAARRLGLVRLPVTATEFVPGMTLAQFLRACVPGRYVVQRRGHYFAVVNGVVHDWRYWTGSRSRVLAVWGIV